MKYTQGAVIQNKIKWPKTCVTFEKLKKNLHDFQMFSVSVTMQSENNWNYPHSWLYQVHRFVSYLKTKTNHYYVSHITERMYVLFMSTGQQCLFLKIVKRKSISKVGVHIYNGLH